MIEQTPTVEPSAQPPAPTPSQTAAAAQTTPPTQTANITNDVRRRSPFLAAVLSTMPGLGQVYLGYYQLGFIHVVVFAGILALLAAGDLGPLIPLASVFLGFFWLYNVVDAARRAVLVNEALAGRSNIELPEDYATPGLKGSVLGGAILVLVGMVLLSRTLFGLSLEWLEDWWPVAIVFFGGFLIYKAKSDKASGSSSDLDED
jgi:hypothetical protein